MDKVINARVLEIMKERTGLWNSSKTRRVVGHWVTYPELFCLAMKMSADIRVLEQVIKQVDEEIGPNIMNWKIT